MDIKWYRHSLRRVVPTCLHGRHMTKWQQLLKMFMSNILILGMYTNHSFFLSNMPSFRHKRPRKQVGTTLFKECHYAFGLLFNQYVCDHHLIAWQIYNHCWPIPFTVISSYDELTVIFVIKSNPPPVPHWHIGADFIH